MTHGAFEPIAGVDHYTEAGRLRADDLAVRSGAAERLARAAASLNAAAAEYRRVHVPPPTREQPFPPPELLEPVTAARACADRYTAVADRLRNAPFPPDPKKAWKRLRGPGAARLLALDQALAEQVAYALDLVAGVTAGELARIPVRAAVEALEAVAAALDERSDYLNGR